MARSSVPCPSQRDEYPWPDHQCLLPRSLLVLCVGRAQPRHTRKRSSSLPWPPLPAWHRRVPHSIRRAATLAQQRIRTANAPATGELPRNTPRCDALRANSALHGRRHATAAAAATAVATKRQPFRHRPQGGLSLGQCVRCSCAPTTSAAMHATMCRRRTSLRAARCGRRVRRPTPTRLCTGNAQEWARGAHAGAVGTDAPAVLARGAVASGDL